jgi:hypothetical protein
MYFLNLRTPCGDYSPNLRIWENYLRGTCGDNWDQSPQQSLTDPRPLPKSRALGKGLEGKDRGSDRHGLSHCALHQCQGFLVQLYENIDDKTIINSGSPMIGYGHPSPRRTKGEYGTIRELAAQEIGSPYVG